MVRNTSTDPLVYLSDGTVAKNLFHKMKSDEHDRVEMELASQSELTFECMKAGVSCGIYFSIKGAATGVCQIVQKKLGPFLG